MKKQFLTLLGSTLFLTGVAQENASLHPCNTFQAMEEAFKADPALRLNYEKSQAEFEAAYQTALSKNQTAQRTAATTYSIPVVFHIMGAQNISDQTIIDAVAQVNRDYARKGSDTAQVYQAFKSLYVDAEMVFVLAKRDPNGNCTNGIIRHDNENMYWNQSSPAYNYSGTGTNRWPREKYLNVYVVNCIYSSQISCPTTSGSYIGGYTYLPGSSPGANADAIVYRASELPGVAARALSHEIGHWFNLSHTFGSSNNPGTVCGDDNVTDTPPTKGILSQCPSSASNSCSGSGNIWNVQNFMDYSSCPKNFTQGQVTRMRTAAASSTAGRSTLWSAANLTATGISGSFTCAPMADFTVNKQSVCAGSSLTFTDESALGASGSISWTFEGGTPSTSTASAPVVTYATPGTYSVSLVATNSSGSNTKTQTSYITVVQGGAGALLPNAYDFEAGNLSGITVQNNNAGSVTWAINPSVGANSTSQSIFLNNASQTSSGGHVDAFETQIYNFANTTNVSLSYYYAYAKKVTAQADSFKVQYSLDCGGTWTNVNGTPSMATMASASGGVQGSSFSPTAAQWKQVTTASVLLTALNNKPSVKFRFWFKSDASTGSSNNLFIDQINLSGTVGLNELEKALDMAIYPNPTNASSTIDFIKASDARMKVSVTDVVGRVVEESDNFTMNGNRASYLINANGALAKGVYVINIYSGDQKVSKKLIIQ
eukprot:TRINITY_DN25329_c0_g1_i1.p1 TRINITY_DN25329_c0_g1~~TRINITY_DN25329_c0_g1_i1.p1  ORF type:complete len:721 (-),score=61.25 TRINITY_DN25329_c0_g1_i1:34-2172(-)